MKDSSDPEHLKRLLAARRAALVAGALGPRKEPQLTASDLAAALLGKPSPPRPQGAGLLGALGAPPRPTLLGGLFSEQYRRRAEWEPRFTHWERSESDAETQRIERARNMVHQALSQNDWLRQQGVRLEPQGSFTNRTNTRLEADIDLRAQHPHLKVEYDGNVHVESADRFHGYYAAGGSLPGLISTMRSEIEAELARKFGRDKVDAGKKAIRVKGLEGSRAEVDVVPAVTHHRIKWLPNAQTYSRTVGVAILSTDGTWTINYPEQHLANGRAKRLSTGRQFKRVVRIVKRLRADMTDRGILTAKVPSFLVECLVYNVADRHFTVEGDDRYARVKRVLREINGQLTGGILSHCFMMEVNGIKPLFSAGQAWTLQDAQSFIRLAIAHIGDD